MGVLHLPVAGKIAQKRSVPRPDGFIASLLRITNHIVIVFGGVRLVLKNRKNDHIIPDNLATPPRKGQEETHGYQRNHTHSDV